MKKSTKLALGLAGICAGIGIYVYLKNKENEPIATFSEDFFDDVNDGALTSQ